MVDVFTSKQAGMMSLVFSFRSYKTEQQPCPTWTSHDVDPEGDRWHQCKGILQVAMLSRLEVSTTTNSFTQIC